MQLRCNTSKFVSGTRNANQQYSSGNISWTYGTSNKVIKIDRNTNSSILTVTNVTEAVLGNYTCHFSYRPVATLNYLWTINATRIAGEETIPVGLYCDDGRLWSSYMLISLCLNFAQVWFPIVQPKASQRIDLISRAEWVPAIIFWAYIMTEAQPRSIWQRK